jgi:outer membrane protein TolC
MASLQITILKSKKMKTRSSILVLLLSAQLGFAQNNDTLVLSETDFLRQVINFAPYVANSSLNMDIQDERFNSAGSSFQPVLGAKYALKEFEGENYYNRLNSEVKIKTPLGPSVSGGFSSMSGVFLNPENKVPTNGLAYVGLEVPLGAGLFTDIERTELKQQKLLVGGAALFNKLEINDYLLRAGEAFWLWYGSILELQLAQESVNRAENRLKFIRQKQQIEEAAAIDTLEAFINYQNRLALYQNSQINWQKNFNNLLKHYWVGTLANRTLAPMVSPDFTPILIDSVDALARINGHPAFQLLNVDSMVNGVQSALNKDYFKPTVDAEFRLQEMPDNLVSGNISTNQNHYVGLKVGMPLFLRKERAKANQFRHKNTQISNKKRETANAIRLNYNTFRLNTLSLKENSDLWENASKNYYKMVEAEQTFFDLGESSLFIVNNRELRWIDSRQKYIESYVKYRISLLNYYHSMCLLPDLLEE